MTNINTVCLKKNNVQLVLYCRLKTLLILSLDTVNLCSQNVQLKPSDWKCNYRK